MAEATVDKRQVSTDALQTLGSIIDEHQKRDAIHLAVEPAVAGEAIRPGEHVGRLPDGTWGSSSMAFKKLGIADPFLRETIRKGQRFWLVIYPRQITSLQHVWEHPDFPNPLDIQDRTEKVFERLTRVRENWVREFANNIEVRDGEMLSYEQIMEAAAEYLNSGEDACMGADLDYDFLEKNISTFWEHYEVLSGVHVPEEKRESFFRCAC